MSHSDSSRDGANSEQGPHQSEIQDSNEHPSLNPSQDSIDRASTLASPEPRRETQLPGKRRLERIAQTTNSQQASAYQGAAEAGFAIVIATLLGYWADSHFETEPRYLIVGAVVGFGSMVLRLVRMRSLFEETQPGDGGEDGEDRGEEASKNQNDHHRP